MAERPNVLWIYCDELRSDALSCIGNAYAAIETPNIDRLAARGTNFSRSYASSPVCVSARAATKTGRLPTSTGIYHNEAIFMPAPVPVESFVERFRAAGYRTINLGKEHVPRELQGFEHSDKTGGDQGELMREADARRDDLGLIAEAIGMHAATWPNGVPYPPDRLTANAVRWLQGHGPEPDPWLLRVSFLQPHTPVVAPEPWASKYADEPWPDTFGPDVALSVYERRFAAATESGHLSAEDIVATQVRYHGMVSWIDDQVGTLLDTLDDLGLRESTLAAFSSDHGAQLGELGGAYGKMTFARPSHQVPLLMAWPGTLPQAVERDELAHSVDFMPTLLELAGLDVPEGLDGRRLFSDPAPDAIVSAIGYGNPAGRALAMLDRGDFPGGAGWPQRLCVRTRRWRYDRSTRQDGRMLDAAEHDAFLADCRRDPREETNLAVDPEFAAVVAQLEGILSAHLADAVQLTTEQYAEWLSVREQLFTERDTEV